MKPHGIWVNCEACGEELKVTYVESVEDEWGRPLGVEVTVEWHECVKEDEEIPAGKLEDGEFYWLKCPLGARMIPAQYDADVHEFYVNGITIRGINIEKIGPKIERPDDE